MPASEIQAIRQYIASTARRAAEAAVASIEYASLPQEEGQRKWAIRKIWNHAYNAAAFAAEAVLVTNGVGSVRDWRDFPGYSPVSWGKYVR